MENSYMIRWQNYFNEELKSLDFDTLLYRLILRHNQKYVDRYLLSGKDAPLMNVMEVIFIHAIQKGKRNEYVITFDDRFDRITSYLFKNYYFCILYLDDCVKYVIYNNDTYTSKIFEFTAL